MKYDIFNDVPEFDYEEEEINEAEMRSETEKVLQSFGLTDSAEIPEEWGDDFEDF